MLIERRRKVNPPREATCVRRAAARKGLEGRGVGRCPRSLTYGKEGGYGPQEVESRGIVRR